MPKPGPNLASLPPDAAIVTVDELAALLAERHCGDAELHRDEARAIIEELRSE